MTSLREQSHMDDKELLSWDTSLVPYDMGSIKVLCSHMKILAPRMKKDDVADGHAKSTPCS